MRSGVGSDNLTDWQMSPISSALRHLKLLSVLKNMSSSQKEKCLLGIPRRWIELKPLFLISKKNLYDIEIDFALFNLYTE